MELSHTFWVLAGYLMGSLSGARIVGRWAAPGLDVSNVTVVVDGTGASVPARGVSPSTLLARLGPRAGWMAAAIDIIKAFLPTVAALVFVGDPAIPPMVAAASLVGHVFPVYHRFRGGFGISPLLGGLLALDPLSIVVAIAAFGLVGLALGSAYIGVEVWPLGLVVWFALFGTFWEVGYVVLANVIYWSKSWREAAAAYRSWRRDPRTWLDRVRDFKKYPDYEVP